MGRKKKFVDAGEVAQGSGKATTPMSSNSTKVVGVEYFETNGTVTHLEGQVLPAPVVLETGAELAEKSQHFWKGITQSKISDKGMGLNFVAPMVVNDENVAKLDKNELERMNESWMNSLIVYVIGKNPSLMALTNYCKS